jgi:NADH dehydrogenase/NADH:ubiquinone oxidoreductase subunit G
MVALKDLINHLGSDNLALDQPGGTAPPVHGVDMRSNYLFNTSMPGVEQVDVILLVGTNPRHEAADLNSRIQKRWLHTKLEVELIGEGVDMAWEDSICTEIQIRPETSDHRWYCLGSGWASGLQCALQVCGEEQDQAHYS